MDIKEKIKNLGEYFLGFSVQQEIAALLVKFPSKWTLFGVKPICEEYNVNIQADEKTGGYYFLCNVNDGFDPVFNAADFIVEQNKNLEAKTKLLQEKMTELGRLFEEKELEELKTLRFVIDETSDSEEKPDEEQPINLIPNITDVKKELKKHKGRKAKTTKPEAVKEEVNIEQVETHEPIKQQEHVEGDSALMDFVKDELNNE